MDVWFVWLLVAWAVATLAVGYWLGRLARRDPTKARLVSMVRARRTSDHETRAAFGPTGGPPKSTEAPVPIRDGGVDH